MSGRPALSSDAALPRLFVQAAGSEEGFDVFEVVNSGMLAGLVREPVAFPKRRQLHGIDPGDQFHQFMLEPGLLWIYRSGFENQIDRAIKLLFGSLEEALIVKILALLETELGFEYRQIDGIFQVELVGHRRDEGFNVLPNRW